MNAKPASLEMVQKLVPVVGSKISFQVVDLNENFRPELMDICGNVLEVDTVFLEFAQVQNRTCKNAI